MDIIHARDLKIGIRVAVYMGQAVSELTGQPPIVTTATVGSDVMSDNTVWLMVDFTTNDQPLPQRYRVTEILGFLLPLATTEHHPDGSVTGTVPL